MKKLPAFVHTILSALGIVTEYAEGVDVSWWEWSFDPTKATKPIHFAFMKLTEGITHIDKRVNEIWQGVKQVMARGGYHYQRSGYSWLKQAEHFLRVFERFDMHFMILDVERNRFEDANGQLVWDNKYDDSFFADTRRIIEYWRSAYPNKIAVIYTNIDTYDNYLYPAMLRLYGPEGVEWLNNVLLWLANPGTPPGKPNVPKKRIKPIPWDFHQHSFSGAAKDYGTEGAVDLNVYNGTVEALAKLIGGVTQPPPTEEPPPPPPPPAPETEDQVYFAEVLEGPIIVRSFPQRDTSTDTTLRVVVGEVFEGRIWAGNGYVWLQIEVSSRVDLIGHWVAVRKQDGSDKIIRLTVESPRNPPPANNPAVRETLGFFDAPMVEHFELDLPADMNEWHGDFDHSNLMLRFADNPNKTQANAIAAWWVLTESDLEWLWHIQPQDEDLYENATLQNKKNWHLNTTDPHPQRPIWKVGNQYRYGLMVYGHSKVQVAESARFRAQFPGGQDKVAEFVKVVGITRDMMKPMGEYVDHVVRFTGVDGVARQYATRIRSGVIPLMEQGLVQVCTNPNRARKISVTDKGIKLMFVPGADFVNKPAGDFWLWKGALK